MEYAASHCASQSIGPANQLFALLIQSVISAKCAISAPEMWPQDYAEQAFAAGKYSIETLITCNEQHRANVLYMLYN